MLVWLENQKGGSQPEQAPLHLQGKHCEITSTPSETVAYSGGQYRRHCHQSFISGSCTSSSCLVPQVMTSLSDKERQAVMRFVTSCSRAPLGGFQHLNPPLTLHKVLQLRQNRPLPCFLASHFVVVSSCAFIGIIKEQDLISLSDDMFVVLQKPGCFFRMKWNLCCAGSKPPLDIITDAAIIGMT